MTVNDLIRKLEDLDGDTEIRIAQQPSWPLQSHVADIVVCPLDGGTVVYIAEGVQFQGTGDDSPYLPETPRGVLGW